MLVGLLWNPSKGSDIRILGEAHRKSSLYIAPPHEYAISGHEGPV